MKKIKNILLNLKYSFEIHIASYQLGKHLIKNLTKIEDFKLNDNFLVKKTEFPIEYLTKIHKMEYTYINSKGKEKYRIITSAE